MNSPSPMLETESASHSGSAWTQTMALLVDAYRDLQSRKLFWLTLVLSVLVAGIFGLVGINADGFTIAGREFPSAFNTKLVPAATFYKYLFTELAIPFWLGFLAAILALIAVGGVFPELIGGGSIDLYLSRPISRFRLFLSKYIFALLFTALQVLAFSAASFAVIGFRAGAWEWGIFLAVPLVTLFFSYLYCVCVLIGIVTRSTLAAILLTVLMWGALFVIHRTDVILTTLCAAADQRVMEQAARVEFYVNAIHQNDALAVDKRGNMSAFEFQRDHQKETLDGYQQTAADLHWWRDAILGVEAPLPKTTETVDLMSRWLVEPDVILSAQEQSAERREQWRQQRGGPATMNADQLGRFADTPQVMQQVNQDIHGRNIVWIVGTSLGFEAVVLALAAWVFCRRDY